MADDWIEALRGRLPRHAALIEALLAICHDDARIRVLQLQCSIARGVGDELSDLDLGIGAADDAWEEVVSDLPDRLRAIAPTVDLLVHRIPEWGDLSHRRLFVQYADGRQVDLVVTPASRNTGRVPGAIVLYDPDGRLAPERVPPAASATAEDVRTWEVRGWELLTNVAKYLERGSAWEALARLNDARDTALRLYAAGRGASYPAFGLTSLLDVEPPDLPPGLEATVGGLDLDELARAARACAALLREAASLARVRLDPERPESPLAGWVCALLEGTPRARR